MRIPSALGPPTSEIALSSAFISHMVHALFDESKHVPVRVVYPYKQVIRNNPRMETSRDRLLFAARELRGWDGPKEVSRQLTLAGFPVSTQTIGNWRNRGVPADAVLAAARIIGCRVEWITNGDPPMVPVSLSSHTGAARKQVLSNVQPGPSMSGRVPLISDVQAGMWTEEVDMYNPGYAKEWLPIIKKTNDHTFAVRVMGDSMAAPHGKTYPEGTIITVDPMMRSPKSGARILAKLESGTVTFKLYMEEEGRKWLKPLNHHPPIFDEFQVIGTVTAKYEPETD